MFTRSIVLVVSSIAIIVKFSVCTVYAGDTLSSGGSSSSSGAVKLVGMDLDESKFISDVNYLFHTLPRFIKNNCPPEQQIPLMHGTSSSSSAGIKVAADCSDDKQSPQKKRSRSEFEEEATETK